MVRTGLSFFLAEALVVTAGQDVNVKTDIVNITGHVERITFNEIDHNLVTFYGIPYGLFGYKISRHRFHLTCIFVYFVRFMEFLAVGTL